MPRFYEVQLVKPDSYSNVDSDKKGPRHEEVKFLQGLKPALVPTANTANVLDTKTAENCWSLLDQVSCFESGKG